jgi:formylglycine-generating enzyme required for sulfatase activity
MSNLAFIPNRPRPWIEETWNQKAVENSLGMKLIRIEPGVFVMGAPENEAGRQPQETPHEVAITKAFYLGKFEVTQGEYEMLMGQNPAAFGPNGQGRQRAGGLDTRRFPIEMITWNEAKEFCRRLTDKERSEGRIGASMSYGLPTEAEWEYCCRAGTATAFCFGQDIPNGNANCEGKNGNLNRTTTVGSYPPNAWGVCDMHGNVWEYCEDSHESTYYANSPRQDPLNTNGAMCILRGGGFGVNQTLCRSALRGHNGKDTRHDYNGFRVVLRMGK